MALATAKLLQKTCLSSSFYFIRRKGESLHILSGTQALAFEPHGVGDYPLTLTCTDRMPPHISAAPHLENTFFAGESFKV